MSKPKIKVKIQGGRKNGTKFASYRIAVKPATGQKVPATTDVFMTHSKLLLQIYIDQNGQPRER